jgi:hypothetical protein
MTVNKGLAIVYRIGLGDFSSRFANVTTAASTY